ncbi:MAG: tachylectin-related carbohydrate-binding protein, partial [Bacteroidota bacterium]
MKQFHPSFKLPGAVACLALGVFFHVFSPALSAQQFYVIDENQKLHLVDIATCQTTFLTDVSTNLGNFGDISFHPNGKLYGITFGGTLCEINLQTGAVTQAGQINSGSDYNSLVANGDGVFYAASVNGDFASLNLQTGAQTHSNSSWEAAGDLTFHDGQLYLASTGDNLMKINIANPSQSTVFFNFPSSVSSIFGIVSVVQDCNEVFTYALTFENGGSKVYLIDFENQQLVFKCTLPVKVYGGASQLEFEAASVLQFFGVDVTQPTCGKPDGSIVIHAYAENQTLRYSLDGVNFQTDSVFTEIPAGSLTIFIDDGDNCTKD